MSNSILVQHQEYIKASFELGDLTSEELNELGLWCVGEGLKKTFAPLQEALKLIGESLTSDDSTDLSQNPQSRSKNA